MKRLLARLVPGHAKRIHELVVTRRFQRRGDAVNARVSSQLSNRVVAGPFAGMRYPAGVGQAGKLVGAYERELHAAIAHWIASPPDTIIDVGCGEGYYAVGLARACPDTQIVAYDADERERERCRAMAALNDVSDRVRIEAECTLKDLQAFSEPRIGLLLDCEGCEAELLEPAAVSAMRSWSILVELHEFARPGIAETLRRRFASTHDVEIFRQQPRRPEQHPELTFLPQRDRRVALDEHRPETMRWAWITPR